MPDVGFVASVRHVEERDGLVEHERLFVGWIVRWRRLRFDDVTELQHVFEHVVIIDRRQQHLLLQAEYPQSKGRLDLESYVEAFEFVGLRHRVK